MDKELLELLTNCSPRWRTRSVKNIPKYIDLLETMFPAVELNMQIHCYLTGESPYCKVCNSPTKSLGKQTCSTKCRGEISKLSSLSRLQKQKTTLLNKYGVENIRHIAGANDRRNQTMKEKYGGLTSQLSKDRARERSADLNSKGKLTLKEKYGINNAGQLPDHRAKCIETLQKNYGVDHYTKSEEFKDYSSLRRISNWNAVIPESIEFLELTASDEKQRLFSNPNKLLKFKCKNCNNFDAIPTETAKWRLLHVGTLCSKCGNIKKGSIAENEIRSFIHSLGVNTVDNDRSIIYPREIDILIPSANLGIEFHGLYWHNDLRVEKNVHLEKLNAAKLKNINLVQIFEDEWTHKKDIVKSRLLNLLNKNVQKIHARKCIIKEISYETEREFLESNHIQGHHKSSVKLGMFYGNTLVSVMTFSKPNLAKGQKKEQGFWELLRFCNIKYTTIAGSASRLFSYFVKNYCPSKIVSFADKRWSSGTLYHTLGFTQHKDSRVNYWYIDQKLIKRIHRFSMRKNKDDIQSISEYENRLQQGYLRVWDCGNSKFVWKSQP